MGFKGASTFGEVVNMSFNHHHHYASTPHLFVFQTAEDDADLEVPDSVGSSSHMDLHQRHPKEPVYSSAFDVRKETAKKQVEAVRQMSERYDTLNGLMQRRESIVEDPLAVSEDDIARIETFFKGYKTQVWVCQTMANLYFEKGTGTDSASWQLRFTGVPLLLLDAGETRSRNKRQLQLIIAEKGTGFALWRDVVDNLTSYRTQEPHFHTFYLSSDHRQRLGLSFNDGNLAMNFHSILEKLTSDPANICLSGPGKKKEKTKEKIPKYKAPKKANISLPCNFNHVTNVDPTDKARFFSLQLFSRKTVEVMPAPESENKYTEDDMREKAQVISV